MSWKTIVELEARIAAVDARLGVVEAREPAPDDLADRIADVDLRLKALEDRIDGIELKVNLARPGKKTQRSA